MNTRPSRAVPEVPLPRQNNGILKEQRISTRHGKNSNIDVSQGRTLAYCRYNSTKLEVMRGYGHPLIAAIVVVAFGFETKMRQTRRGYRSTK